LTATSIPRHVACIGRDGAKAASAVSEEVNDAPTEKEDSCIRRSILQ
jgi:hypothetical protein